MAIMASGIARGRVRTTAAMTTTTELSNMVAINQTEASFWRAFCGSAPKIAQLISVKRSKARINWERSSQGKGGKNGTEQCRVKDEKKLIKQYPTKCSEDYKTSQDN